MRAVLPDEGSAHAAEGLLAPLVDRLSRTGNQLEAYAVVERGGRYSVATSAVERWVRHLQTRGLDVTDVECIVEKPLDTSRSWWCLGPERLSWRAVFRRHDASALRLTGHPLRLMTATEAGLADAPSGTCYWPTKVTALLGPETRAYALAALLAYLAASLQGPEGSRALYLSVAIPYVWGFVYSCRKRTWRAAARRIGGFTAGVVAGLLLGLGVARVDHGPLTWRGLAIAIAAVAIYSLLVSSTVLLIRAFGPRRWSYVGPGVAVAGGLLGAQSLAQSFIERRFLAGLGSPNVDLSTGIGDLWLTAPRAVLALLTGAFFALLTVTLVRRFFSSLTMALAAPPLIAVVLAPAASALYSSIWVAAARTSYDDLSTTGHFASRACIANADALGWPSSGPYILLRTSDGHIVLGPIPAGVADDPLPLTVTPEDLVLTMPAAGTMTCRS